MDEMEEDGLFDADVIAAAESMLSLERQGDDNEQGVVFLFGMVAHELGYLVEAVQEGFPDSEAKRQRNRASGSCKAIPLVLREA